MRFWPVVEDLGDIMVSGDVFADVMAPVLQRLVDVVCMSRAFLDMDCCTHVHMS
jgi:hypothetical protein